MDTKYYILIILIILLIVNIIYYNILTKKRNGVNNAFASIDVMLKRRNDLIPNLISCVKGYIKHENEVLEKINILRNNYNSNSYKETMKFDEEMELNLNNMFMLFENYPDLKANENFINIQNNLSDLEENISAARRTYNAHVTEYNSFIGYIPNNIFASIFGFNKLPLFEISNSERNGKIWYNEDR